LQPAEILQQQKKIGRTGVVRLRQPHRVSNAVDRLHAQSEQNVDGHTTDRERQNFRRRQGPNEGFRELFT